MQQSEREAVDQRLSIPLSGGQHRQKGPGVLFGQDAGGRNNGCLAHIWACGKVALL